MSAKLRRPEKVPSQDDLRGILAYHLRLMRFEKGWSQERLALEAGLDRTYVSAVERRVWNISLSNLEALAKAVDAPPWKLLRPVSGLDDPETVRIGHPLPLLNVK